MGSSEPLTHETMQAPDLVEVVRRPGPFLSLYLNTEGDLENAARRSATRWRVVLSDLEARGVPGSVLDEIGRLVPHAHLEGRCLAVVADAEGVLHTEHGPAVSSADEASWEPVPHLLPIVRWRQSEPPYVVALTDRTGADLYAFRRGAPRVTELVDRIEAKLLAVAGDVRAVQLLQGWSLPGRVQALVHVVHGDRSLWFGPDLTTHASTDRELKELGVDSPQQGEAHDVLAGATLGTGASIRVLETSTADGARERAWAPCFAGPLADAAR